MVLRLAEIVVTSETGVLAEVEVKNAEDLDLQLASALVGETVGAETRLGTRYVMVASQDTAYLWRLGSGERLDENPVWELPMREYLRPYLAVGRFRHRLRFEELKLIIFDWLGDLADSSRPLELAPDSPLVLSGFAEALRTSHAAVIMAET